MTEPLRRQFIGSLFTLSSLLAITNPASGKEFDVEHTAEDRQAVLDVLEQADGIGLGPREVAANTDLDEARAAEALAQLEAEDRVMKQYHLIP